MRDTAGPMATRTLYEARRRRIAVGGGRGNMATEETPDEEESRTAPHGWEVEYLGGEGGASKTNHPAAEAVVMEATIAGSQTKPALVLYDEHDEQIALYSPSAWLACRRNARPNGTPTGGGA